MRLSGCFSQNWMSVFRVMMCIAKILSQFEIFYKSLISLLNQLPDFPHHRGQFPHDLIIPESDNPQPQRGQSLLPPGIFLLLQIVDVSIHLNHQRGLVTVKVNNKPLNDLLSPKTDSQLLGTHFLPQNFLSRSHLTPQFFGALKFFFGYLLTWDDVFDWHGLLILPAFKTNPSPVSPKGEKLRPSSNKFLPLENHHCHQPTSPLPIWEGRGERSLASAKCPIDCGQPLHVYQCRENHQ